MAVNIPLRQLGVRHVPSRLALWLGREMERRVDLQTCPTQVRDRFVMDDYDTPRELDGVMLFTGDRVPPVPHYLTYGFPYARSSKGQIVWKRAHVEVQHG